MHASLAIGNIFTDYFLKIRTGFTLLSWSPFKGMLVMKPNKLPEFE